MGRYPSGPRSCVSDPACRVLVTSMSEPGPLLVFAFWGFVLTFCSCFQLWKLWRIRRRPLKPVVLSCGEKLPTSSAGGGGARMRGDEVHLKLQEGIKELVVSGFSWSYFGEACYYICCLTSLQWIALYVLILFDTYNECEVGGIDNLCFYGNNVVFGTYELSGKVFFTVWWLSAIWWTVWVLFKGKVHNWFHMPAPLTEAAFVHVWTSSEEEILSANVLSIVYVVRYVKRMLVPRTAKGHSQVLKILRTVTGQRYFLFEGMRVLVNDSRLSHARIDIGSSFADIRSNASSGLSEEEAQRRLEYVGPNQIPFQPEPLLETFVDEMFTFFHVYQLVMYMLQFWNSYLFVATLMTFIVLLSSAVTIYTRRKSQLIIAKITHYETEADVLRGSKSWTTVDASSLVPGDLVRLKSNWLLPCDLLILEGSCIVDESALTGEAMPVQKYLAPNSTALYSPDGQAARHTLFSGTKVLQAGTSDSAVEAIVTATGMSTSKGQLLSSILYPQKMVFKYDEELPVVAFLLVLYGIVCFCISIVFQNHAGAQSYWVTKWIYCMAIINQIMSPLLPVALEVGQVHSVDRLKKLGIYCLNPKRIAIAGKIRVFCFDKTGTLTKEGLEFVGVRDTQRLEKTMPFFGTVTSEEMSAAVLKGLATCHALSKFNGEYVGNEVEVKMFKAVGWDLVEHLDRSASAFDQAGKELKIIRRNEFDHARATMSVIVEDAGEYHIYCKGSFEKIGELSMPATLPTDYSTVAQAHALDGCYVLGLGHRSLGSSLTLQDVLEMSRDNMEKDLVFVSLVLFRNELKAGSKEAIEALKAGEVRPVMLTGDNAQCGHYIAKQAGLIASHVQVLLGDMQNSSVVWTLLGNEVETSNRPLCTDEMLAQHIKGLEGGLVELAVTGKAFNFLRTCEVMNKVLMFTRIGARFTPTDKVAMTAMLRDRGLVVGMCGDGGNDCGALRAAHAGMALSEAEASVVSPFTSKYKSVASVVDLLREGRASLHTSFACYKFLIMYGLMFSILKLCSYWYGIIPCQMDYIFIDGVAVLILGYAMTLSYPEDNLTKDRPTSSLLGPVNVASVLGIWSINLLFLVSGVCMMSTSSVYVKWPAGFSHEASWWTLGDNWESTVLFFTMYFQFITAAFVFTFGARYRKSVFSNTLLVVSYSALVVLFSLLLLLPSSSFTSLWHVASEQFNRKNTDSPVWILYQQHGGTPSPAMPFSLRLKLWLLILVSMAANCIWQKVVVEGFVGKAVAKLNPTSRLHFHL